MSITRRAGPFPGLLQPQHRRRLPLGIKDWAFPGFISSPSSLPAFFFLASGGGGERKEINIFLIKMHFYKNFFHLMLQELSITFLLLGCLLAGWKGRDKRRKEKRFHLQMKELLREGTQFRKCKPQNCIPISIPPPSWKPGATCVWGSGASAVRNKSPSRWILCF